MKCSGGCLPTPINLAFLTPGPINILGAISGISPGMPAFGCCLPTPLGPILPCVGPTCYGSLFFRYYIDTTLTILGAGTVNSFCFGPYPGGICLANKANAKKFKNGRKNNWKKSTRLLPKPTKQSRMPPIL